MKRILVLFLVLILLVSIFAGCKKKKAEIYTLKVSIVLTDTDPIAIGLEAMAKEEG